MNADKITNAFITFLEIAVNVYCICGLIASASTKIQMSLLQVVATLP